MGTNAIESSQFLRIGTTATLPNNAFVVLLSLTDSATSYGCPSYRLGFALASVLGVSHGILRERGNAQTANGVYELYYPTCLSSTKLNLGAFDAVPLTIHQFDFGGGQEVADDGNERKTE